MSSLYSDFITSFNRSCKNGFVVTSNYDRPFNGTKDRQPKIVIGIAEAKAAEKRRQLFNEDFLVVKVPKGEKAPNDYVLAKDITFGDQHKMFEGVDQLDSDADFAILKCDNRKYTVLVCNSFTAAIFNIYKGPVLSPENSINNYPDSYKFSNSTDVNETFSLTGLAYEIVQSLEGNALDDSRDDALDDKSHKTY